MAPDALPGMMSLIHGARYCVQSTSTLANLSRPTAIGATTNAVRSSRNACSAGSVRTRVRVVAVLLALAGEAGMRGPFVGMLDRHRDCVRTPGGSYLAAVRAGARPARTPHDIASGRDRGGRRTRGS